MVIPLYCMWSFVTARAFIILFQYCKCPFLSMERPWMKSVYDTFPANCVENLLCTRSGIGAIIEGSVAGWSVANCLLNECRRANFKLLSAQLWPAIKPVMAFSMLEFLILRFRTHFCWQCIILSWFYLQLCLAST